MDNDREYVRNMIATLLILGVLGIFIIGLAYNKDKIKYSENDFIVIANINGNYTKIANPNEYFNINPEGLYYNFSYNNELNTVDLTIHYKLEE